MIEYVAHGGVVHILEHQEALGAIKRLKQENDQLRKYATYLSRRLISQALIINVELSPIVAASIIDDLDDAAAVAGIDPRQWR